MPNHITNQITSGGLPEIIELLTAEGEEGVEVDFNLLIPMPEILKSDTSSPAKEGIARVFLEPKKLLEALQRQSKPLTDSLDCRIHDLRDSNLLSDLFEDYPPKEWPDEQFELLITYMRAIKQTGHANWHSWSIENWGTKWNAYYVTVTEDMIQFDTAWSCPQQIMRALAKLGIPFTWEYADEDIGQNAGTWTYTGHGEPVHTKYLDPISAALRIKGYIEEEKAQRLAEQEGV